MKCGKPRKTAKKVSFLHKGLKEPYNVAKATFLAHTETW